MVNPVRSELACFRIIWSIPPMRSFLSGKFLRGYLNSPLAFSCCAHILSKAQNKYPHFKLYLKNIRLLDVYEHKIMDSGTEAQRKAYSKEVKEADWQKIWDLREELKSEYEKHFPKNVGILIDYRYSEKEVSEKIKMLNGLFLEEQQINLHENPQYKNKHSNHAKEKQK